MSMTNQNGHKIFEFYGYKKCSTCREAHQFLETKGISVPFRDFVATPPEPEVLRQWVAKYGQGVMPFVNTKGTVYRELGLKDKVMTEAEWITMLSADGKLLKRPLLVMDEEIILGFDQAAYERLKK
jgi:arsenate reductase (glutaredoxin)